MKNKLVTKLGLPEKEALVYVVLLENDQLNISKLSAKTNIPKSSLYLHINNLLEKGYIKKTIKGKRTEYRPENPKKLLSAIKIKKNNLEEVLPDLSSLFNQHLKNPTIEVYEGSDGNKRIYEIILAEALFMKAFFSPDKYTKAFSRKAGNEFIFGLNRKGCEIKVLSEDTKGSREHYKYRSEVQKIKYLPKDYSLSASVLIFNNKVAIMAFENSTGLIIDNPLITDFFKDNFDFYWKNLE